MSQVEDVIDVREVSKIYKMGDREIKALDNVSLTIKRGEYVSIIGPSGSGKSTLMHLIGCLDIPTMGCLRLDGVDISKATNDELSELRNQKIGFVFQSFNLLPKLSVLENVELPLIYSKTSRAERLRRAKEAVDAVGLASRMQNRPTQLSGGQSQRVAIARALVTEPSIILADEPTGALDSKTGEEILELFRSLYRRGHTVALVTHDPDVAAETERRIELKDGKIVSA